jgi:hypothetical protein
MVERNFINMKNLTCIFLILTTSSLLAFHKDFIRYKTHGNVKVFVHSSYEEFFEINKVEIIGKLAEKLSNSLNYKDTIILEFKHNFSNRLPNYRIVDTGNTDNFYILKYLENVKKRQLDSNYQNNKGICIREVGKEFNIKETIKILEYLILNQSKLKFTFNKQDGFSIGDDLILNYDYYGLNKRNIRNILQRKDSEILLETLKTKIEISDYLDVKVNWENNIFNITNSQYSLSINTVFCITKLDKGLIIFTTNKDFFYVNKNTNKTTPYKFKTNFYQPFLFAKKPFQINIALKESEGIVFHPFFNLGAFVFSEKENKIIEIIYP